VNEEILKNSSLEPMGCREVGSYLPLFVLGGRGMTMDECRAVKNHLQSCSRCANVYKENSFVVNLLQSQKDCFIEKGVLSRIDPEVDDIEPTIEESFKELQDKLQRTKARIRRNKRNRRLKVVLKSSTAVAACLVIGVLTWMVFQNYSTPQVFPQDTISRQVAMVLKPDVKVELVIPSGNIVIGANQKIAADKELKTLLINDKHQMIMNSGTSLSIEPLITNSQLGCLVRLKKGEIYTHVEHDGNPFIVQTNNGKAVITGTTFNIKADNQEMELVVTEGTIKFENKNGSVNVKAGQKSMLTANAKPQLPVRCDTELLTAWATGYEPNAELAVAKALISNESDLEWPWPVEREQIVLNEIDYDCWAKEKQDWFISEFPWIFQLQNALVKEGIEIDYLKLLIQSGDIWQFSYAKIQPSHFSALSSNSLLKAVSNYGLDKQWLLNNVTATKYVLEKPILSQNVPNVIKAFEEWYRIFENLKQSSNGVDYDILEHLFRASVYLANTRSLIWFAVKDGNYILTDKERSEILILLQQQVNAAIACQENVLYQPSKEKQLCDSKLKTQDKWYQWASVISKNMEEIINIEKKLNHSCPR
jgi:ferric-dicitrate binding protein FerR (iron transport regulator)